MPKGVPNKRYTPEFKIEAIETMQKEKLSYMKAKKRFGIKGQHSIQDWERIYLTYGAEGFYVERRGRTCSSGGKRRGRPPKLVKKTEEDLIAEVPTALNALVSKEECQNKKHK